MAWSEFTKIAVNSETTDGKQFDVLLDKVAGRGRTLFRLFQHPSMTIVKGAGLVMKAIIEEGEEEVITEILNHSLVNFHNP